MNIVSLSILRLLPIFNFVPFLVGFHDKSFNLLLYLFQLFLLALRRLLVGLELVIHIFRVPCNL